MVDRQKPQEPAWYRRLNILQGRQQRYQAVFSGPDGEWVLADIYRKCRVHLSSHTPGDPYHTAYCEGIREVAVEIARILGEDADTMLRRANQETAHG